MLPSPISSGHVLDGGLYYVLRATLGDSPASRRWITTRLLGIWEKMLARGATTMWETENGSDDFDFAGSLCHGWSSLPIWFHQAVILGVYPLAPSFRKFSVSIYPAHLSQASGSIPTPHGPIQVSWEKTDDGLLANITAPAECTPILAGYPEYPPVSVKYNGDQKELAQDTVNTPKID